MPSVVAIASIVVLLSGLVCYAFLAQSVQRKKEQKARVKTALQARARTFAHMLASFPEGFLPNELRLLVQKSLVDIYGQLAELEPSNNTHKQSLLMLNQEIAQAQRQQPRQVIVELTNISTIKETKKCLEELYKFVLQKERGKRIGKAEADIYRNMIKNLVTRLSVDSYFVQARTAEASLKYPLALHQYETVLNLMTKENANGQFSAKITKASTAINELKSKLKTNTEKTISNNGAPHQEDNESEWNAIENDDNPWKKKQVYD